MRWKLLKKSQKTTIFRQVFKSKIKRFRCHAKRIQNHFAVQRYLKQSFCSNHVYIHIGLAEDYRCRTQGEIQSTYWGQTQVTIHPVVAYRKSSEKLLHQFLVFISDEQRRDAKFVFALIQNLVPVL